MPRLKTAGNTQIKKKCVKGFPCGYSCQGQGRKCRKPLEGQAANYQDWLKLSSPSATDKAVSKSERSRKRTEAVVSRIEGQKKEGDLNSLIKKSSTLTDDELHDLVLTDYPQIFKDYFSDFMVHADYDHFAMKARHLREDLASGWINQKYQPKNTKERSPAKNKISDVLKTEASKEVATTDKAFVPSKRGRKGTEAVVSRFESKTRETKKQEAIAKQSSLSLGSLSKEEAMSMLEAGIELYKKTKPGPEKARIADNYKIWSDMESDIKKGKSTPMTIRSNNKIVAGATYTNNPATGMVVKFLATHPDNALFNNPKATKGGGTRAIVELAKIATQSHKKGIQLEALPRAIPFYEKLGFQKIPNKRSHYRLTHEKALELIQKIEG